MHYTFCGLSSRNVHEPSIKAKICQTNCLTLNFCYGFNFFSCASLLIKNIYSVWKDIVLSDCKPIEPIVSKRMSNTRQKNIISKYKFHLKGQMSSITNHCCNFIEQHREHCNRYCRQQKSGWYCPSVPVYCMIASMFYVLVSFTYRGIMESKRSECQSTAVSADMKASLTKSNKAPTYIWRPGIQ